MELIIRGEEEDSHQSITHSVLSAMMGVSTCGPRVE